MQHVPNLVSAARLLLVVPLVWAISTERATLALVLGVVALASDALDGIIARHYGVESELGRILDPLADKVLAAAVALALLVRHALPLWYVVAIVARDVLIVAGSVVLRPRIGHVPPSLPIGKAAATSIGIVLLAVIAGVPRAAIEWLALASTVLLAWSLAVYAARLRQLVRRDSLSN